MNNSHIQSVVKIMPNPFTHVLINTAIFYPFRKKLGKYWWLFAAFSGLLPDFDFCTEVILKLLSINNNLFWHGGFFHTFGFVLVLGIVSLGIYTKNKEFGKYGFILAIGSAIHILLDFLLGGGAYFLMLFYPFSTHLFRLHLLEQYAQLSIYSILDAILIIILLGIIFIYQKKREKSLI